MKKNLFIIIMLLSVSAYTQNINSINKQFKLSLINDGVLTIEDTTSGKLCYDVDLIQLKLDSIGNYFENFYFYKVTLGKNKIVHDKRIKVSWSANSCDEFIVAFSADGDVKYRLKGFPGNDLLFLLRDIKNTTSYTQSYYEILSDLNLFVEEINLEEVYEALVNLNFESMFLRNCKEGKKAHGKNKQ